MELGAAPDFAEKGLLGSVRKVRCEIGGVITERLKRTVPVLHPMVIVVGATDQAGKVHLAIVASFSSVSSSKASVLSSGVKKTRMVRRRSFKSKSKLYCSI